MDHGLILGGGSAAAIQSGSVITRLASTKLTAGAGNHAVATGENAVAVGTSLLSLVVPILIATLVILLVIIILLKVRKKLIHQHS